MSYDVEDPLQQLVPIDKVKKRCVSTSFLGGLRQEGPQRLEELVLEPEVQTVRPRTIVGLLTEAAPLNQRGGALLPDAVDRFSITPANYTVRVNGQLLERSNQFIPPNLHLVCGDPNLELMGTLLNYWAHNTQGDVPGEETIWKRTHSMLSKFLHIDVVLRLSTEDFEGHFSF